MDLFNYLADGASFQSKALLAVLQEKIKIEQFENIDFKVCRFDNLREQGYTVYFRNLVGEQFNFSFAENRSSDDIVIYEYKVRTLSNPTFEYINKNANRDAKFFEYLDIENSSEYILDKIREILEEN